MTATTSPLWIKICGLRSVADVAAAVAAGADAVGFVFHATSPRNLSLDDARAIAACVPTGVDKVAVFQHPTQAEVDAAIDAVQPAWVQTDADDFATLVLPVGQRVLPVYRTDRVIRTETMPPRFLLESGRSGSGERADWTAAARHARSADVVLAGGLDADNVAAAICAVRPCGVDVSTGVESSRGVKDAALIIEFVSAARRSHAQLTF